MPRSDLQSRDSRPAPAHGKVTQVYARAVGRVEERPQTRRPERRRQSQIAKSIQQIRKAFVTALARSGGDPQNRAGAAAQSRDHRSAAPAFAREDLRARRKL